jgi:ketosteroid isomerase-like protein
MTMRITWFISAIAAIGLAASVSAQQADQSTWQEIKALMDGYNDTFNKQDAVGIARFWATDGVSLLVTEFFTGSLSGPQQIENYYRGLFKPNQHSDQFVERVWPSGTDGAIAMGSWLETVGDTKSGGHWTAAYAREGNGWKIRLITWVPNPPSR